MAHPFAKLLEQAFQARRENRLADAKRDFAEAAGISRKAGKARDLAAALTGLGQIERDLGNCGPALNLYQEATAIYRTEGDALRLAHTIRHVGDIHRHEQRLDLAEPCYHEALGIYRAHPGTPPLDLANALRGMALLKTKTGQSQEARQLWQQARDLYVAVGVNAGAEESTRQLAELAKVTG